MYQHYPIALRLEGHECLVIGGGRVAYRKILSLLECGAKVKVISPEINGDMATLVESGQVTYVNRRFTLEDLQGVFLVIGATDDRQVNSQIGQMARERNLLVNIVDQPRDCNFIIPAIHRMGPLSIAVTTDGKSPGLAARIKEDLAGQYQTSYGIALEWLGEIRNFLLVSPISGVMRRQILLKLASLELVKLLEVGDVDTAIEWVDQILPEMQEKGEFLQGLVQIYAEWVENKDT